MLAAEKSANDCVSTSVTVSGECDPVSFTQSQSKYTNGQSVGKSTVRIKSTEALGQSDKVS